MTKIKKDKNKNSFLKPDGSLELVEEFPGIDFMPYEKKKIKKTKKVKNMPLKRCTKENKPGWQYGSGKCYTYTAGNKESQAAAKLKAIKQGFIIAKSSGEKFEP